MLTFLSRCACAATLLTSTALLAAEPAKTYADVEVKIDDTALVAKAASIRTLYVTLYDAAGTGPMPYGAARLTLEKDASKGTIYKGKLDSTVVKAMGSGEPPKTLRIKARLDKDGSAGPDAPGDLVGVASNVALGSKAVITIDKAM